MSRNRIHFFRSTIIRSGSYYEGTRVGLPDEFDYMINLTEIETFM